MDKRRGKIGCKAEVCCLGSMGICGWMDGGHAAMQSCKHGNERRKAKRPSNNKLISKAKMQDAGGEYDAFEV